MSRSKEALWEAWRTYTPGPVSACRTSPGQPRIAMLRLDQIQSWASGNKYFKLKYAIAHAIEHDITRIVSKGGMFSNHLAALAEACSTFDLECIAVIRAYADDEENPSIIRLRSLGARIVYLQPKAYGLFGEAEARQTYPGSLFIPEGGSGASGIRGASEILEEIMPSRPTHIIVPGGTMGTVCGILRVASASVKVVVVPAWKGCTKSYVQDVFERHGIVPQCEWDIWPDAHYGGFGKYTPELHLFSNEFQHANGIQLDPVYTAKMMYAVYDKIKSGYFHPHDFIMTIHTGGLQGIAGMEYMRQKRYGNS